MKNPNLPEVQLSEIRVDSQQPGRHDNLDWAICPLTNNRLTNPVLLSDGMTYEKDAVCEWLAHHPGMSPSTGGALRRSTMTPNLTLAQALRAQATRPNSQWWLGLTRMQCSGEVMTRPVVLSDGHSYDASEVHQLLVNDRQLISRRAGGKIFEVVEHAVPNRALQQMVASVHSICCNGYEGNNLAIAPAFYQATECAVSGACLLGFLEGVIGGVIGGILGGPPDEWGSPGPSPLLGVVLGFAVPATMVLGAAAVGTLIDRHYWAQEVERTRLLRSNDQPTKRPSLWGCLLRK